MLEKQNDPVSKEKKVNISPINYSELNKLSEHFQKHFVPQKELSAEQSFCLPISNPISEQLVVQPKPVMIDVPSELPKVSLVNKSFLTLKNHLAKFDKVVKERTIPSALTEGTWGFEHTKEVFITQVIPFLNSLRESFKDFDNGLHDELNEVKTVFNQMEAVVEQYLVHAAVNSLEVIDECESMRKSNCGEYNRNLTLELQAKESPISKLRAHIATLKGKNVSDNNEPVNNTNVIAPGMFRLDLEPLSHRLKNNREAHEDYLKKTKKHTDTLRGIVEHARKLNPSDPYLEYACKFTIRVLELLAYVSETYPSSQIISEKLVAATPMNKTRKVRRTKVAKSVIQIILWYLDLGCSKHMSGQRSQLINFVEKFLGTFGFGNDHIAKIMGVWLPHLNFATINELSKQGLVRGLPKLKYEKDHLCSAYSLRKSKKHTPKPKSEDSIKEKLYLLHMDLCGLMRIESINMKKYILVIVDDYSRFTWVKFLRLKDEILEFVIKFLKMIQVRLNTSVRNIRTDNRREFVNQTLKSYYEDVETSHQTFVARTPQQNGVVERRN
ncbi:retrovirus-related pol polyprotein from transposon TNT 1-94 [Tanacetum coccineum]